MNTNNRRLSHLHLEGLQKAAYAELGYPPPTFSAETLRRRKAENLDAFREGGDIHINLIKSLKERGLDPSMSHSILENSRRGVEQVHSHHNLDRILSEYSDAPTPHVDPFHHAILKKIQSNIETLYRVFPRLSFASELQKLNGRVTLSTLPTGEVNARTLIFSRTNEYLVVFEPTVFDFLYNISNNFSQAINLTKAQEGAQQYAVFGQKISLEDMPLCEAIRYGAPNITRSFFHTLSAFLRWGLPPLPEPYDEEIFSLAEHLRLTGVLFIAAHEYSHILLGHKPLSHATEGHFRYNGPVSKTWYEELEADWLACSILDAILTARGIPLQRRFMGVHLFFISSMLVELGKAALQSGQSQQLMNLIPKDIEQQTGTTHPIPALRIGNVNQWLEQKYPPLEYRGTQYYAALLLEVAASLWQNVEPLIFDMHARGFKPSANWTGFDIFEHN